MKKHIFVWGKNSIKREKKEEVCCINYNGLTVLTIHLKFEHLDFIAIQSLKRLLMNLSIYEIRIVIKNICL